MNTRIAYLIFTLFLISGCIPEQSGRIQPEIENSNSTTDTDTTIDVEDSEVVTTAYWYDNGEASTSLTVDITNLKNGYILGDDVNLYLANPENYSSEYCMYVDFVQTYNTNPKKLLTRLIPSINSNPVTGKITYYFRAAINTASGNEACNATYTDNPTAQSPNYSMNVAGTFSYVVSDICTDCLNIVQSESVKIYKMNTTSSVLEVLPDSAFDFDSLVFRVDMNSNTDNNQPTCTNAQCNSLGFNCCVSGQCVNDGQLKMTRDEIMSTNPDLLTEFDFAESLKTINSNWYLSYPQYYYICLENVPNDDDDGDLNTDDPVGDATARLNSMINDYFCTEELAANSLSTPFHTDPIDGTKTYRVCGLSQVANEDPSMYFRDVMMRMYSHCGCDATIYTEMVNNCPKYTYKAVYDGEDLDFDLSDMYTWMTTNSVTSLNTVSDLGSVTGFARIECVAPEVDPNVLPFQDLEVIVSSKTAPHRFFDKMVDSNNDSYEITDVTSIPDGASGEQEGVEFQYLDNDKLFPANGSYNMNSLLGQMNVNLTNAVPAKKVDLEFDKLYYIATIEGYYTPCPNCAKDYWFPNFSAQPVTTQGVGLQSIGYTTTRDQWGSNTTFGNYEDTIFGRACWLPPTMIPYSHNPSSNSKTQRLNRLETQAAYYMNGYQRDWFGFNKGALIGSFDGVTWFAVGKGRVVRASTTKLYLAINAPFADLTQANDHIVSVQEWDFITTGAQYDYDPNEAINSSLQNEAGLCQRHHSCEVDSDCITTLGWEYVCADVNSYQTSWPKFDPTTGKEVANDEKIGTIVSMLAQGELAPGDTSKKCVYRGAGSPCRIDYTQITDEAQRKALTCAPNFYCANLTDQNKFNKEVARYASSLEDISEQNNHYYGQEANILGRPKQYMATTNSPLHALTTSTINAMDKNILLTDPTAGSDMGICRPGKQLPSLSGSSTINWKPQEQHKSEDTGNRTDYISQIGGCNSHLYNRFKTSSCPILDSSGNYIHLQDSYLADEFVSNLLTGTDIEYNQEEVIEIYANSQNSCGLESIDPAFNITPTTTADEITDNSAFKSIEGKPLNSSSINLEPTLARDACFRRAGSVCHTDLDCSPNYKHADVIDLINPSFFGNEAEKKYWEEYLVCGQGPREPMDPTKTEFNEYDITANRCCREIGSDITMYTEDTPGRDETIGLSTHKFASTNPNASDRYSRYSNIPHQLNSSNEANIRRPSANTDRNPSTGVLTNAVNILNTNQWQTINQTGSKTCCGGGWIRKFADGTNNWSINRLNLDVSNFQCLNFKTPLVNTNNPSAYNLEPFQLNEDSQNLCLSVTDGSAGCAQHEFLGPEDNFDEAKPVLNTIDAVMILDSDPTVMVDHWATNQWSFIPLISADSESLTVLDWVAGIDEAKRKNISVRLPSFITWPDNTAEIDDAASNVKVFLERPTNSDNSTPASECTRITPPNGEYNCIDADQGWASLCGPLSPVSTVSSTWQNECTDECCYLYEDGSRTLKVAFNQKIVDNDHITDPSLSFNSNNNNYAPYQRSVKIEFISPGTLKWEKTAIPSTSAIAVDDYAAQTFGHDSIEHRRSSTPGNAMYYLNRLSKLELLGIPQVTYEPLYCTDNYQKLVPGLFKEVTNVVEFNNSEKTFLAGSEKKPWTDESTAAPWNANSLNQPFVTTGELVNHEPIFSDSEFMCCSPLGSTLQEDESQTKCCSGYSVQDSTDDGAPQTHTCSLPPKINLNVYFNRFVSGESSSPYIEEPLIASDFDEETGFPKQNADVYRKLQAIATTFCGNTQSYTRGGAFGEFVSQPRGNLGYSDSSWDALRQYSIIDSQSDEGTNNNMNVGYDVFQNGIKWNNHIYCAGDVNQ